MTLQTLDLAEAIRMLGDRIEHSPQVHLILGSGMGALVDRVEGAVRVPFGEVPGLPASGVQGHAGAFIAGRLAGVSVLVQAGRFHLYEGHPSSVVLAPVRIAHGLGVRNLVVTNAAGGVTRGLDPGSLMLIDDHINFMGRSVLAGPVVPGEERFPDMSAPYDPHFQQSAVRVAATHGIPLRRGVYAAVLGPNYETPAEVRMLERMGADAIGMSTVPEVTCVRARGTRVLGVSLITNRAAGLGQVALSHTEVLETGAAATAQLATVLEGVLPLLVAQAAKGS